MSDHQHRSSFASFCCESDGVNDRQMIYFSYSLQFWCEFRLSVITLFNQGLICFDCNGFNMRWIHEFYINLLINWSSFSNTHTHKTAYRKSRPHLQCHQPKYKKKKIFRNIARTAATSIYFINILFGMRAFDELNTKWVRYLSSIHGSITKASSTPKFHSSDWILRDFDIFFIRLNGAWHNDKLTDFPILIFGIFNRLTKFHLSIYRNAESKTALLWIVFIWEKQKSERSLKNWKTTAMKSELRK